MRRNGAKLARGSGDTDDDALATASAAGADADVLGELCCRAGGSGTAAACWPSLPCGWWT